MSWMISMAFRRCLLLDQGEGKGRETWKLNLFLLCAALSRCVIKKRCLLFFLSSTLFFIVNDYKKKVVDALMKQLPNDRCCRYDRIILNRSFLFLTRKGVPGTLRFQGTCLLPTSVQICGTVKRELYGIVQFKFCPGEVGERWWSSQVATKHSNLQRTLKVIRTRFCQTPFSFPVCTSLLYLKGLRL